MQRPERAAARRRARSRSSPSATPRRSTSSATTPRTCWPPLCMELYPGVKISIGPPIDNGFYYDFDFPDGVTLERGRLRAHRGRRCASTSRPTSRSCAARCPSQDAIEHFRKEGQDYKVELIEDLVRDQGVDTVSFYENGPFLDLCRGPHAPSTGRIGAVKLQSVAGAYWRGDSNRPMLTRVYGTAFFKKKDLDEHLERLEQAKARDHRRLGPQLGLFTFSDGLAGRRVLAAEGHDALQLARRAQPPHAARARLRRGQDAAALRVDAVGDQRPLGQVQGEHLRQRVRGARVRPQADELPRPLPPVRAAALELPRPAVPLRRARPAAPPRAERHAARPAARAALLPGRRPHLLPRGPGRTTRSPAAWSSRSTLYGLFGLPVDFELSTPARTTGSATTSSGTRPRAMLEEALRSGGYEYRIAEGEGAFYAPKIDLHMTDSLGRSWQLGTVQLDYNLPERFGLTYTGADNAEHMPVMIHRALFGSFERFIGILIEETAGELPVWLAPVQAIALPIADRHIEAAQAAADAAARGRRPRRDRRAHRVGRAQDPRRRAAEDPVHARHRRQRGAGRHASPCAATARAIRARSGSTSSPSGSPPSRSPPRSAGAGGQRAGGDRGDRRRQAPGEAVGLRSSCLVARAGAASAAASGGGSVTAERRRRRSGAPARRLVERGRRGRCAPRGSSWSTSSNVSTPCRSTQNARPLARSSACTNFSSPPP